VLEIFQRGRTMPDQERFEFLDALAAQAAIAIDNATLFNDLQSSNTELVIAYDSTIEGWGKALNLRDMETEGHTQRVTELTVQIARAYGMHDREIVHIRRGALLHDIGKMGVPDSILMKEGPLTPAEEKIMQKHPLYAFEILMPIAYLRPALDIPYCHHEKWDGSGYPRGLRGAQIPLAARIFTLSDTWDALISRRRYHAAWPREKVEEYIRARAGTHFDPELVELFLANVAAGENGQQT
jgi:putative nucleotidyltransferase with HDIG domain